MGVQVFPFRLLSVPKLLDCDLHLWVLFNVRFQGLAQCLIQPRGFLNICGINCRASWNMVKLAINNLHVSGLLVFYVSVFEGGLCFGGSLWCQSLKIKLSLL